ncbi:hypothetical protein H4W31_005357 [Plantactinospora soyae]|uniref:Uncharacterized protein n=1 Tax=Plantactinospora soyae TaxID=1544732 RepID=A0A927R7R4_9ACTN|nr:hypothetical protein [Plantactinospora soyae]
MAHPQPAAPLGGAYERQTPLPAKIGAPIVTTGITDAGFEGTNRVSKTVARDAYGCRNPGNQRLRIRTATTRCHRGHLNPAQLRRTTIPAA